MKRRTIAEIYAAIIAEKETQTTLVGLLPANDSLTNLLADLANTSKAAIWRLFVYVMAVAIYIHEGIVFDAVENKEVGSIPWIESKALEFQFGDPLVLQKGKYLYNPVVVTNRLVTLARAKEVPSASGVKVLLKVAKGTASSPSPLSATELSAFKAYIAAVKFAGTKIELLTAAGDIFKLEATVYYDPLILNSTGALLSDPSTFPVNDAITEYITTLQFGGTFFLWELTEKIKKASGVKNFVLIDVAAKYGAYPYTSILASPTLTYTPYAGYMTPSMQAGETFSDLITYLPYA